SELAGTCIFLLQCGVNFFRVILETRGPSDLNQLGQESGFEMWQRLQSMRGHVTVSRTIHLQMSSTIPVEIRFETRMATERAIGGRGHGSFGGQPCRSEMENS
ncbi:MAG: hypothetical protein ACREIP_07190, partial [Alphaproteobacteria bacterium]